MSFYQCNIPGYSKNKIFIKIGIFSIICALIIGGIQEIIEPNWSLNRACDLWSFAHFLSCFGICFIITYYLCNAKWGAIFTFILSVLFEPIEQLLLAKMFDFIVFEEGWFNSVADVFFNSMGIFLAYVILKENYKSI